MFVIARFDTVRILRINQLEANTWVAVFFAVLGIVFAVLALQRFRDAKTTINPLQPRSSSSLVVVGVYRLSRNPMYLGMALVALSSVLYYGSAWCLLVLFAFVAFITRYQIIPEERAMQDLFGEEFETYKALTRRWI
jgi:protein-S-isoprenylcysteine O-methyltransferase Ste14